MLTTLYNCGEQKKHLRKHKTLNLEADQLQQQKTRTGIWRYGGHLYLHDLNTAVANCMNEQLGDKIKLFFIFISELLAQTDRATNSFHI